MDNSICSTYCNIIHIIYRYPKMSGKSIMKYFGENAESIMKELNIIKKLNEFKLFALPVLVVVLFFIGAYITSKTPSKTTLPEGFINAESDAHVTQKLRNGFGTSTTTSTAETEEGFENKQGGAPSNTPNVPGSGSNASSMMNSGNKFAPKFETVNKNRCPNILIQHGSEIFLYNSKVEKVPGVNPIRFKNLEDYTEFMEWLQGRGIRCPVLFLQFSYDTQGKAVYKIRPSPMDLQGGLSPNVPYSPAPASLVQIMDASRDNPPFNNKMYDGYDPMNFNNGDYTTQDAAFTAKERTMFFSDNPMDSNWCGINYSRSVVGSGAYADRTRPTSSFPPYLPPSNKVTSTKFTPKTNTNTKTTTNTYIISKPITSTTGFREPFISDTSTNTANTCSCENCVAAAASGYVPAYVPPINRLTGPSEPTPTYTEVAPSTATPSYSIIEASPPPDGFVYGADPNAPENTNLCPGPDCPCPGPDCPTAPENTNV